MAVHWQCFAIVAQIRMCYNVYAQNCIKCQQGKNGHHFSMVFFCCPIWFKTLSSFKNSRFCSVLETKYKAKRQDHKKVLPLFHCIVLNFSYLWSILLNNLLHLIDLGICRNTAVFCVDITTTLNANSLLIPVQSEGQKRGKISRNSVTQLNTQSTKKP